MPHLMTLAVLALSLVLGGCGEDAPPPARQSPTAGSRPEATTPPPPRRDGQQEESWDFYPARIDDKEAFVTLDLAYRKQAPLADAPHLLWVNIEMPAPGPSGVGTRETAQRLTGVEARLGAHLEQTLSARFVARIRGKGLWQLRLYAPGPEGLEAAIRSVLDAEQDLAFTSGHDADPEWAYYLDFLCPDPERTRWMQDRRVVEQLEVAGDTLTARRPVDHWLDFPTEDARSTFEASIAELGFVVRARNKQEGPKRGRPFGLRVQRTDPVALEQIHRVVMQLQKAAEDVDGRYDGWGCPVVKQDAAR
jgi:hypothetical protein